MKTIKIYLAAILGTIFLFTACQPDEFEKFENPFNIDNVDSVAFHPSFNMMIADGISELDFLTTLYDYEEYFQPRYTKTDSGTILSTDTINSSLPLLERRIPEGTIKYFYENGTEITSNNIVINNKTVDTIAIYAQVRELKSAVKKVYVREKPAADEFETITYNVVFHIAQVENEEPDGSNITSEHLEKRIDRMNKIYARQTNKSANGADTKIQFKLAEYNESGDPLEEKGVNRISINSWSTEANSSEVTDYLFNDYVWDYTKYLNVWICSYSYWIENPLAEGPPVFIEGFDTVPGFETANFVPAGSVPGISSLEDVGIVLDIRTIFDEKENNFAMVFGKYFGVVSTMYNPWAWPPPWPPQGDPDLDYCPDTYSYDRGPITIGKTDINGNYFRSDNIMDEYSLNKTVTLDQARRMRKVIESCPYRQAYTISK